MTDKNDPHSDLAVPGDPKDNHQQRYTTAPENDRVGTQDKGVGGIQNQEDHPSAQGAQTFKGQDSLVTRDLDAFEHAPEEAAYAGAQAVPGNVGSVPVVSVPGNLSAGIAMTPGATLGGGMMPDSFLAGDIDPNPKYTPPSEESVPHPNEGAADVPAGAPGERYLERNLNNTVSDDEENPR